MVCMQMRLTSMSVLYLLCLMCVVKVFLLKTLTGLVYIYPVFICVASVNSD